MALGQETDEDPECGRGLFLVIEGVDGCGKSTQARALVEALGRERPGGPGPLHVREPGTTVVGEAIRAALLDPEGDLDSGVELMLFAAARRQNLRERVEPALASGRDVVCERFHGSTFAYQGVAGEISGDTVLEFLDRWASDPLPDLELWLDVDPEAAAARRSGEDDRIEAKGLEFQKAVARGYREYVDRVPRARRIDGSANPERVLEQILIEVRGLRVDA